MDQMSFAQFAQENNESFYDEKTDIESISNSYEMSITKRRNKRKIQVKQIKEIKPMVEEKMKERKHTKKEDKLDLKKYLHLKNQITTYQNREYKFKVSCLKLEETSEYYHLNLQSIFKQLYNGKSELCLGQYLRYYKKQTSKDSMASKLKQYAFTEIEYHLCRAQFQTQLNSLELKGQQQLRDYKIVLQLFQDLPYLFQKTSNYQSFLQNIKKLNLINERNNDIAFSFCTEQFPQQIFSITANRISYFFIKNYILHILQDISILDSQF